MSRPSRVREAPFALRVVQRKNGRAAVVYRRKADPQGHDRLQRLAALSPLAFTAAGALLRDAVSQSAVDYGVVFGAPPNTSSPWVLTPGPFHPLDNGWGARVACLALIAAGLQDGERLLRAAQHLRHADANEAAWWLGLLTGADNSRPLRALRILTEAVQ